jgi:hypothetical protein
MEASPARNVFVGIPILNRLDVLVRSLQSIDHAVDVVVVNNNTTDHGFTRDLHEPAGESGVTVLDQARNLGVAASWNLILRTGFERGHRWVYIGSNDTLLHPGRSRSSGSSQSSGSSNRSGSRSGCKRIVQLFVYWPPTDMDSTTRKGTP